MDTPEKTVTKTGTPIFELRFENSPVFNYINNLSPIKTVPISQTLSSLSFSSPPHVFTSPQAASRFTSHNNSSKDDSASNQGIVSIGEEAVIETEPPQIINNDCTTTTTSEDGGMDLLKMYDNNVKPKSETPDWENLILDNELLIYNSPTDSEAFRCLLQRTLNTEPSLCNATSDPVLDSNESESSDSLSMLHRGVRRRYLDFEMTGNNKQTLYESSSRCVLPNSIASSSIGLEGFSSSVLHSHHDIVRANQVPKSSVSVELSPKKKRRKSEQAGEGETSSCKRCNCKKSKCLKLYCECFAAGVYCIEPCSCVNCFNKPIHKDIVLATRKQIESRNPLAFAPKVIKNSVSIMEATSTTPASARHKRGCNCKKSNCLKKYCECYQSGVGCSINCRCEACKNAFGRKNGQSSSSSIEQDDENKATANPLPPSTPAPLRQPLAQLPVSSNNMLIPQHLHGASGSSLYKSQAFSKNMSLLPHSRIDTENVIQNINNVSPDSKKPSDLSPWRRNDGRKMILSIPTFPPLSPNN